METKNVSCPHHGEYVARVINVGASVILSHCPACNDEDEQLRRSRERAAVVAQLRAQAEIPLRYVSRTFDQYRADTDAQRRALNTCRAYAGRFEDRARQGGGLVLTGRPGTGKTHLACAIARAVIDTGRAVRYATSTTVSHLIRASYARERTQSEREVLRQFYRPDLLILDEIGVKAEPGVYQWDNHVISEIVCERYAMVRPTILATNLTEAELRSAIGERAVDRMREGGGAILAFDWESYRPKVSGDAALTWPALPAAKV